MTSHEQEDIRTELAETRQELKQEIAGVRTELGEEISELRGEMTAIRQDLDDFKQSVALEFQHVRRSIASVDLSCRRQGVLMEALQSTVEQIAEGLLAVQEQMRIDRDERSRQSSHFESLLRTSFSALGGRVSRLEERL